MRININTDRTTINVDWATCLLKTYQKAIKESESNLLCFCGKILTFTEMVFQ